jgi:hypothetical protein
MCPVANAKNRAPSANKLAIKTDGQSRIPFRKYSASQRRHLDLDQGGVAPSMPIAFIQINDRRGGLPALAELLGTGDQ